MEVRDAQRADVDAIRAVVADTELFPPEMLEELMQPHLDGEREAARWFVACDPSPVGFAYAAPEALTDGAWNLVALGVLAAHRRTGAARALMAAVEDDLRSDGARIVIVDTSSTDEFDAARRFYAAIGYDEEARIRDFWAAGDDKVVFRRAL